MHTSDSSPLSICSLIISVYDLDPTSGVFPPEKQPNDFEIFALENRIIVVNGEGDPSSSMIKSQKIIFKTLLHLNSTDYV